MSGSVVDRRAKSSGRSLENRERYIARNRSRIRDKLLERIKEESWDRLVDKSGKKQSIPLDPSDYLEEPHISLDPKKGKSKIVVPGNKTFKVGDEISKGGEGDSDNSGPGKGTVEIDLTDNEFLEILFDSCELPNLLKKQIKDENNYKFKRYGYSHNGAHNKLSIIRSFKESYLRRIAQRAALQKEIDNETDPSKLELLKKRLRSIVFIDDLDLRYTLYTKQPQPSTAACIFMLMDVSGSVTDAQRLISKMFFYLMYRFVESRYSKVECVFIVHTDKAYRVTPKEFFNSRLSGGTEFFETYKLVNHIIDSEFSAENYNNYLVHFSDGETWKDDLHETCNLIKTSLSNKLQFSLFGHLLRPGSVTAYDDENNRQLKTAFKAVGFKYDTFTFRKDVVKRFLEIFEVNNEDGI